MPSIRDELTGFVASRPNLADSGIWTTGYHEDEMEPSPGCAQAEDYLDEPTREAPERETPREEWAELLREAAGKLAVLADTKRKKFLRLTELEQRVEALEIRVGKLGDPQSLIVPVTTLDPEPFELLRDIPVVVRPTEDGYLATLYDANIGITGDTREEAVGNLRELIVDLFDDLEEDEDRLAPMPGQQLAVLRSLMRRRK